MANAVKIPRYSGTGDAGFLAWLYNAEGVTTGMAAADRTRHLLAAFEGRALDTLMLVCPQEAFQLPWDQVRPTIVAAFAPVERSWEVDFRFKRKVLWIGSMEAYITAFQAECGATSIPLAYGEQARLFMRGLEDQPAVRIGIQQNAGDNIATLFAAARMYAPLANIGGATSPAAAVDGVSAHAGGERARRQQRGRGGGGGWRGGGAKRERGGDFSGDCWKCGKPGHRKADCTVEVAAVQINNRVCPVYPTPGDSWCCMALGASADSTYDGTIATATGRHRCRVLIDSGSARNIIAAAFADRCETKISRSPQKTLFRFANGTTFTSALHCPAVQMRVGEYTTAIDLTRCELAEGIDVILGRPWLVANNPTIDWATGAVYTRPLVPAGFGSRGASRGPAPVVAAEATPLAEKETAPTTPPPESKTRKTKECAVAFITAQQCAKVLRKPGLLEKAAIFILEPTENPKPVVATQPRQPNQTPQSLLKSCWASSATSSVHDRNYRRFDRERTTRSRSIWRRTRDRRRDPRFD
jgi:hypothetical protein